MTIATQTKKVTGVGNGSGFVFSFSPIKIFDADDLDVTHIAADGTQTPLVRGTGASNYSVAVAQYPGVGSVSYPADLSTPMTSSESIVIKRVLTLEQQTNLGIQGGYNPEVLEEQLDKLVSIDLQQQDDIARSLKVPVDEAGVADLPSAADRASGFLSFDGSGVPMISSGASSVPVSTFMATVLDDLTAGAALTTLGITAYAQTILDDTTAAAARTTLGATSIGGNLFTATDAAAAYALLTKLSTRGGMLVRGDGVDQQITLTDGQVIQFDGTDSVAAALVWLGTEQDLSGGGTTYSWTPPTWAKEIHILLMAASTTGTGVPVVQIGDAEGLETSGYAGSTRLGAGTPGQANLSSGFSFAPSWAASSSWNGIITLRCVSSDRTKWVCSSVGGFDDAAGTLVTGGSKTLSGQLTTVSIVTANAWDVGAANAQAQ